MADKEKDKDKGGHSFKQFYFKKLTWCSFCGEFIWGVVKAQGYRCKICHYAAHKGDCWKKANQTTNCSMLLNSPSKKTKAGTVVSSMNQKKRQDALLLMCDVISTEPILEAQRLDGFLTVVCTLEDYSKEEYYICFNRKPVADSDRNADGEEWDVFAMLLRGFDGTKRELAEMIPPLKVLEVISQVEENKARFVSRGHTTKLVQLLKQTEETGANDFIFYRLIFTCLRNIFDTKARKLAMIKSSALDHVISFLRATAKFQKAKKDKEIRVHWLPMRDEGARLLYAFHTEFYDKDLEVTDYICSRRGLDILIEAAKRKVIQCHQELEYKDITKDKQLYNSLLCQVYKGTWKGKQVAIKVFNPGGMGFNEADFRKEIALLSLIQHPNVCKFYGACTTGNEPFLVMDYFPRGSLKDVIEHDEESDSTGDEPRAQIDTSLIVNMTMNAANGIRYLHTRNIIHRDIKAGNFLIDERFNVFVIDFGVSRIDVDDPVEKMTVIGTPTWMAPEVMMKLPYTNKADTYSFVLVIWGMLTGKSPYNSIPALSLANVIVNQKFREQIPSDAHPTFADIIRRGWDHDPAVRPDFQEILDLLWAMKDERTGHYYCRVHEAIPFPLFSHLFTFLHPTSLAAFAVTCRRYHEMVVQWRGENSLSHQGRWKRGATKGEVALRKEKSTAKFKHRDKKEKD